MEIDHEAKQLKTLLGSHNSADIQDAMKECNCMAKLDEALVTASYFDTYPRGLQEEESLCRKKLQQVDVDIEAAVTTLREDQQSVYEYDRLISQAHSKCQEALAKQKYTEEEIEQLEKQTDASGQQFRQKEKLLETESEAVLQLELHIRTKQCEQVNVKLQALRNRTEFNETHLDRIDEEINSLKKNLSQRKEQAKKFQQLLQEARQSLAASKDAQQKLRDRLEAEAKVTRQFHEEEKRYRGERKEMQDVMDNSIGKRRKYVLDKIGLEKQLVKLAFVKAHHNLQRKAQLYKNRQNCLLDYHDVGGSCRFPD